MAYTPLVKSISRYFLNITNSKFDYDDLVQEGFVGLLIASKKYNENIGTTLGVYAKSYIWGRIYRSLSQSNKEINLNINPIDSGTDVQTNKGEFTFELYDFIESMYDEDDAKILKMVFSNYKKREVVKVCKITSDYYEELIQDFKNIFE